MGNIIPHFYFEEDLKKANEIADLQDRVNYLRGRKKEYEQALVLYKEYETYDGSDYHSELDRCRFELERLLLDQEGNADRISQLGRLMFSIEKKRLLVLEAARDWNKLVNPDKSKLYQLEIEDIEAQINSGQKQDTKPSKDIASIWWKRSDRLLRYLLEELAKSDFIHWESDLNKIAMQHFINKNQKSIGPSIKQNSSGAGTNKSGKPKYHEDIDTLIDSLPEEPDTD
jgi:hypothetical protein